jgi:hypothetical protein
MNNLICLALFVVFTFDLSQAQTIIIPDQDTSVDQVETYLRQNSKTTSVLEYWTQLEIESHSGLDSLVEDFELALQSKITWRELEARLFLAKKVSFGREHRHLLLDYFDKRLDSVNSPEAENFKMYSCVENKIGTFDSEAPCSKKETSLKNLPIKSQDFPIVLIDGVENSTQKLKHLNLPSIPLRFVFLSLDWLPYEFVGRPEELLKQKIPLNAILKTSGNQFQLTKLDPNLEDKGKVLLPHGELSRLIKAGALQDTNWWMANKKWAGPTLLVLAAALVYSQRDKTLIIQTP